MQKVGVFCGQETFLQAGEAVVLSLGATRQNKDSQHFNTDSF
jgi:hypothetical protein